MAKGAAVDVLSLVGRGELSDRRRSRRRECHSAGAEVETPLHRAAANGHVECAQLLLAAKASVDIKDNRGWGPQPMSRF